MYSPSHQEGCTSLLSRRIKCYNTTPSRTKTTSQKANKNDHKDHSLVWLNEATSHAGLTVMDRSWWTVLTKHSPLEEAAADCFGVPASRIQGAVWKDKKIWHRKMSPPGWQVSNMLLGKSRETAPERMKRLGQTEMALSCGCVWWWK